MHCLLLTAHAAVDILKSTNAQYAIEYHECYNGLVTCLRALEQVRATTKFVEVPLRVLLQAMTESNIEIPRDLQGLSTTFQTAEWLQEVQETVQSEYVADYSATHYLENARMDALIASWVSQIPF
jgi:hypothetical protein